MTAEIAIYNKSSVALAADSAVTIQGGSTYKIYNGAEKLFALSKAHPVGVMVYGSGSLCGVPWELIIKQFRKKHGSTQRDTLEQYAQAFWAFLVAEQHLIPPEMKENSLCHFYEQVFRNEIFSKIEDLAFGFIQSNQRHPTIEETYNLLREHCVDLTNMLRNVEFYENLTEQDLQDALPFASEVASHLCEKNLPSEESQIPEALINAVASVFVNASCKKIEIGANTGIVFAGFGDQEYFPVVLAFNLLGFINGKLRLSPNSKKSAPAGASGLIAYAQEEEVDSFVSGISKNIKNKVIIDSKLLLQNVLDRASENVEKLDIDEQSKQAFKGELIDTATQMYDQFNQNLQKHIQTCYIDKVVDMVAFLPKQDLAEMAESLVNLTAFKRKVSNDSETVGGPVDVAIISKGDGFIWVKRKHYFKKDLNQHYFDNQANGAYQS
ncbi:Uncharacterised protein [Plesiomonas shigelloides]|uniref:hypothetical protein n=1 Tax=Plesiomonas shigelloides TaxID=703 RepID=UPI0007ED52CF|nr:hypothetical protein [Plesiomonas shigelloides]SBT61268.1 Uncharacterised protein [Plesiomonas shigelloides]